MLIRLFCLRSKCQKHTIIVDEDAPLETKVNCRGYGKRKKSASCQRRSTISAAAVGLPPCLLLFLNLGAAKRTGTRTV